MNRFKKTTAAWLVASVVALQPVAAFADDHQHRDRYEDRWAREHRDDRRDYRDDRYRRDDRRWDDGRWDDRTWDPVPYYRQDYRRYPARRLGRYDRIYRGSDSRYYCRRDDGTTGLIVGGITGGVLGNILSRGRSKTLGTIIGASAGAALGQAIDQGDIVCR
jgi:hypothetical protein